MNQEKIGKFIASLRKEKGLTQEKLAEKLGVSKNAVSKWERGLCLMDMSLLKPICSILEITVNDLLSGEKLNDNNYQEKLEENIINTITYSNQEINNKKKIIKVLIIIFIIITLVLTTLFIIDINRMKNNKQVLFSTWGFDYTPPIDLSEEKLNRAIKNYLVSENKLHYENEKWFTSINIYLIDELSDSVIVYAWILEKSYYLENDELKEGNNISIPCKFTLKKENDLYKVIKKEIPRDGNYYKIDMEKLFPSSVLKQINNFYKDGTYERLEFLIDEQVDLYYENK